MIEIHRVMGKGNRSVKLNPATADALLSLGIIVLEDFVIDDSGVEIYRYRRSTNSEYIAHPIEKD